MATDFKRRVVFDNAYAEDCVDTATSSMRMQVDDEEREDGEGGDSGGQVTLSVEQLNAYLLATFTEKRREQQNDFAPFKSKRDRVNPHSLLGKKLGQVSLGYGEQLRAHPLLSRSQQFSGDDPKITAIPCNNPEAQENFPALRLEKRLANQNQLQKGAVLAEKIKPHFP